MRTSVCLHTWKAAKLSHCAKSLYTFGSWCRQVKSSGAKAGQRARNTFAQDEKGEEREKDKDKKPGSLRSVWRS